MNDSKTVRQKREAVSSSIEEYLETIYRLETERGVVRVKEISAEMNVSYASTSEILRRMASLDLVLHERYGYVRLRPEGRRIAENIIRREQAIVAFFHEALKLPVELASEDACRLEHEMSDQTAQRLDQWLSFVRSRPEWKTLSADFEPPATDEEPLEDVKVTQ